MRGPQIDPSDLDLSRVVDELATQNPQLQAELVDQLIYLSEDSTVTEEEYVKACCYSVFRTAYTYDHRTGHRAMEKLVRHVAADTSKPTFAETFSKRFVNHSKSFQTVNCRSHPRDVIKLLKWSFAMMQGAGRDKVLAVPNLTAFVLAQCMLLEKLKIRGDIHNSVRNIFAKNILAREGYLVPVYLDAIGQKSSEYSFALNLLMEHLCTTKKSDASEDIWSGRKAYFLTLYKDSVVSSRTPVDSSVLRAWVPFVRDITHEDMKDTLLPEVTRLLKRQPAIVIPVMASLLQNTTMDLSRYSDVFFPAAVSELRNQVTGRRDVAVSLVCALAHKSSDAEILTKMIGLLGDYLMGKKESLSQFEVRLSFLSAVDSLTEATSAGTDTLQKLAEVAMETLVSYIEKKEPHTECKQLALSVLAKWITINEGVPASAAKLIVSGFGASAKKSKDGALMTPSYLQIAIDVLSSCSGFISDILAASNELAAHITTANTSVPGRHVGILAANLLLSGAGKTTIDSKKDLNSFFAMVVCPDSFLNNPEAIFKCSDDEGMARAHLFATVMKNRFVLPGSTDLSAYFKGIFILALHPSASVTRSAVTAIRESVSQEASLVDSYLSAICAVVLEKSIQLPLRAPSYFVQLIFFLAAKPSTGIFLSLLFLVHHPFLRVIEGKPFYVWTKLCATWSRTGALDLSATLTSEASRLHDFIFSDQGLLSVHEEKRECAAALLTSLGNASSGILSQFLPSLLAMLNHENVISSTSYEAAVMETPEGELCQWVEEGSYQAEVVQSKNVKRGKHSGYSAEDEEWERKVAAEIAAKKSGKAKSGVASKGKGKKQPEVKVDPQVQEKLDKEKAIRDGLKVSMLEVNAALHVLNYLSKHAREATRQVVMTKVLEVLYGLMKCSVCPMAARSTHLALSTCLDAVIQSFSDVIAVAVQLVVCEGEKILSNGFAFEMVDAALQKTALAVSDRNCMSCSALMFIFPLLRLPLEAPGSFSGDLEALVDNALSILTEHCNVDFVSKNRGKTVLPTTSMISLLLKVIGGIKSLQAEAGESLVSLSRALVVEEIEGFLSDIGTYSGAEEARLAVLRGLKVVPNLSKPFPEHLVSTLWVLSNDSCEAVADLAMDLWDELQLELDEDFAESLLALLSHKESNTRVSTGKAIAAACVEHPNTTTGVVRSLIQTFQKNPDEVVETVMGIRQGREMIQRDYCRIAVAQALGACVDSLDDNELLCDIFTFMLGSGLADAHDGVWEALLVAGLKIIEEHGAKNIKMLLPIFERNMVQLDNASLSDVERDRVHEGLVVFMGTIARHMDPKDQKIVTIIDHLVEALKTPSHSVQKSVAQCLAPLMSIAVVQDHTERFVQTCITQVATGATYGERKGAAFGLAAMIKGLKLSALKKYDVLNILSQYIQDKGSVKAREGALFAYDRLFTELGNKFEPYVDSILPYLLKSFSDSSPDVREAAAEASQMIMANLTGYGVQRALPRVLASLDEKAWKTKVEAIALLGSMAYCAPRQLSSCLPMVVPRLLEVMADPNKKVQEATRNALDQIGSVIRNLEIKKLVPVLMKALNDPAESTQKALQDLMRTSFVHSVDPASLALIVPIVRRGLRDRSTSIKRMSAQVVGSICSLISDVKDILPYTSTLLKYIKQIVVDPIPEVRAVASKSLGALFKGLGEEHCGDLVQWLFEMLDTATTSVQRSGAAQALAQVLRTIGKERTEELLPQMYDKARHSPNANTREAYMGIFIYMPDSFGSEFSNYLADVFPIVISGLDDDLSNVRDTALRAGQALIIKFARSETDLLLPALEEGIRGENWRIRLSSVQLLGSLLLRLAGASGALFVGDGLDDEEDGKAGDGVVTLAQEILVEDLLGTERRNEIFAEIYLMRSDVIGAVRQMSWRVWKGVVSNTPRMLGHVLHTLVDKIIKDLSSENEERQTAAQAAVGDLVSKMGDTVLQQIIPILKDNLNDEDPAYREGVVYGLGEVMKAAKKNHIGAYMQDLIPAVRDALCDYDENVRSAAGSAFQTLYRNIGHRAIDEVIPSLLHRLAGLSDQDQGDEGEQMDEEERLEDAQMAMEGIREVLGVCNKEALPMLLPELIKSPMSIFHARALAYLSSSFGDSFFRYVDNVTKSLIETMSTIQDDQYDMMKEAASSVVLCVTSDSVHTFLGLLGDYIIKGNAKVRGAAAQLMAAFCSKTSCSFGNHMLLVLKSLLSLYADGDPSLQKIGIAALGDVLEVIEKEDLPDYVDDVRNIVHNLTHDFKGRVTLPELPGLCQKGGLAPLLPIFQNGLVKGSADVRESAAIGLGELITLTSDKGLGPSVIKITGALIRIVGDRFPPEVKAAILNTLGLLVTKTGQFLKAFLPQLQTTFVKALSDENQRVRSKGGAALAELMTLSRRVDPVVTDLGNVLHGDASTGVQTSQLQALAGILSHRVTGEKVSADLIASTVDSCLSAFTNHKDSVRRAAATVVGVCAQYFSSDKVADLLSTLVEDSNEWMERDAKCVSLGALFKYARSEDFDGDADGALARAIDFVTLRIKDDNSQVQTSALTLASGLLAFATNIESKDTATELVKTLGTSSR